MKKKIIALILMGLLLTGCRGEKLKEGEIYAKEYMPAHDDLRFIPIVISNGKEFSTRLIPYMYHYSDEYCIKIREYDKEAQEWDTAKYYTTKEVYDACEVGGNFEFDENRDYESEKYTRERQ